jgi:putative oxygen-independent coproporphyrinogen III oxidase
MHYSATSLPPLSLYIHIPWCIRKCPYCDFNSHTLTQSLPERAYIDSLIADLQQELGNVQGRALRSIFFGGGTPSLLSAQGIERILQAVMCSMSLQQNCEITLEANPGATEHCAWSDLRAAGINRLSIGVQSFQDKQLQVLGRIHSSREALTAIDNAVRHFDVVNIDLMHGLPQQSVSAAVDDLQQAIIRAPHISWYQLTIEPNTAFYHQPPPLPAEDCLAVIQQQGEQLLAEYGYQHYEISAFSLPGKQAQHNLNYWQFGDYIGIGAGAHGKNTDHRSGTITRRWKTRAPGDYLNPDKPFIAGHRVLANNERIGEFIMNVLRLKQGFTKDLFEQTTRQAIESIIPVINHLQARGMLCVECDNISATTLGWRFLNDVVGEFF